MPKFPSFTAKISKIKGAVFEKYRANMVAYGQDLVRLHIGDSYIQPVYSMPLDENFLKDNDGYNRYCNTFGIGSLRQALMEKLKSDNYLDVGEENILITAGATNALSATVQSVLDNDEDILVLTPCWPIFPGIIHSAGANIMEVPFYTLLYDNTNLDIGDHLQQYLTEKSVAIYINSPNNPSGKVLNKQQLSQLAQFARENDLWLISDEAYDGLLFDGHEHFSIASMPEMFLQTVSVFTFSKIFMFAGLRLGYAVGTEQVITNINKIMVHQLYSPSTITQQMMVEPVRNRHRWMKSVQNHYQELRDRFVERLDLNLIKPEATYFLFFSIEKYLRGRDYNKVIDDCFKNGVSVAPGEDFGRDFSQYIRLCFTGEPPERLEKGIDRLLDVLL